MSEYQLKEVSNPRLEKQFLDVVDLIYYNVPQWVRPLDGEIKKVFDVNKNKRFLQGNAIRWILFDSQQRLCGRIAAFFDEFTSSSHQQPTGGVGFFECINNQEAANVLFDQAKKWLQLQGMQAMDGPVNFGNRDFFWGCLKEGFHRPLFNMPFNPGYYNDLFTRYGFENYFNQYTYHVLISPESVSPIVHFKAERLKRDQKFTFSNYDKKSDHLIAAEFSEVFNKAWANFPGVRPISTGDATAIIHSLKPIIDPRLIILAHYQTQPIGFFIMIPDLNQIIGKFHGKMNWVNRLRLLYGLKVQKKCSRVIGLIFGVIPEFQGKGIEAGLVKQFEENATQKNFPYTDMEMNWIGDFNPTMMKLVELIGGRIYKTHVTYRYLFDRTLPFERAATLNSNN
ncbi:MAG: hypothetical protein A2W85_17470 [Bacteroidetes bacterium GWF2_41_31]|nr:MAG: hypothetical protein A2W85_17470 [Bacteroidetes bacterium GWF2_41_31]